MITRSINSHYITLHYITIATGRIASKSHRMTQNVRQSIKVRRTKYDLKNIKQLNARNVAKAAKYLTL